MVSRIITHLDLDYFYAQCEEIRIPSLKDKPVVVCMYSGRTPDSGAVSTANYVARRYGVKSGIPIAFAKRMLKDVDAVFLPVDDQYYQEVSSRIMSILKSNADKFEQESIDEAYLDVTHKTQDNYGKAREVASKIKDEILRNEKLTCSIGIGPNKVLAKIASDMQKPNGLTIVPPPEVPGFLSSLDADKIPGIGKKTAKALSDIGVKTIDDLAKTDVEKLVKLFGKKLAYYFHDAANGIDQESVEEKNEPEQFSRILTLKENTRSKDAIAKDLDKACEDLYQKVSSEEYSFRNIGVIAIMEDLTPHTRSETLEHDVDAEALKNSARSLMEKIVEEYPESKVRRIGVKVADLVKKGGQKTLTDYFAA
ncbi:MAG: DNA polymerase IV [Thaumarchaeota archaeon]|nr:DNA polymerase IV [Nitrososphaerota archaeon]